MSAARNEDGASARNAGPARTITSNNAASIAEPAFGAKGVRP